MSSSSTDRVKDQMGMPESEVVETESVRLASDSFVLPAPTYNPQAEPVVVIDPKFLAPYPVDLTVVRKVLKLSDGNFVVNDVKGTVIFKVKGSLLTAHSRRIVQDAAGNPIVSLTRKILTAHNRWNAYKGDSSDPKDLLFTCKASHLIQFVTKVDVFLPNNNEAAECGDVKLRPSDLGFTIYAGDSIIAQMQKKEESVHNILLGKTTSIVTIYPKVDFAFIVALLVTLDETNSSGRMSTILSAGSGFI